MNTISLSFLLATGTEQQRLGGGGAQILQGEHASVPQQSAAGVECSVACVLLSHSAAEGEAHCC
jgi:hypothetical protein